MPPYIYIYIYIYIEFIDNLRNNDDFGSPWYMFMWSSGHLEKQLHLSGVWL